MSKKCYRFFGGLLTAQEKWLNKMSSKGYRLVRTGKMLYEFEQCKPNEFQYCIDFIGEKSKTDANEYPPAVAMASPCVRLWSNVFPAIILPSSSFPLKPHALLGFSSVLNTICRPQNPGERI